MARWRARELWFADSRDLLANYVSSGPGQLFSALPGPPEPGTWPVGQVIPLVLVLRDRMLRIPTHGRVLAAGGDGEGHWSVQIEMTSMPERLPARSSGRGPVKVRVTLEDGRRLDAVARRIEADTLQLDVVLPPKSGEIIRLAIRPPGRLWPIRLVGEPRAGTGGSRVVILFRGPREEIVWGALADEATNHPSRLMLTPA